MVELPDGMAQVTGVPEKYAGHPLGTPAIEVHEAYLSQPNYAMQAFGRPNREKESASAITSRVWCRFYI